MDTTIKVTSIHIVAALVAAILSAVFSLGWLGIKNDFFGVIISIVILYAVGQFSQKGISPFFFTWVISYTLFVMYL